jgi:uncharacterized membrane protein YoaK (UPF0700 family)
VNAQPDSQRRLRYVLFALTVVSGAIDAVSFLALGRVFTANMTGNVVLLAFAVAGAPGLSVVRSGVALVAFLAGAAIGGRLGVAYATRPEARWPAIPFTMEAVLLLVAALAAIGIGPAESPVFIALVIVLTAVAMGIRNATVRKLAIPDLTTTVLTLTLTGLAADSSIAGGANPRWKQRGLAVVSLFAGAALGALAVRTSVVAALLACSVVAAAGALATSRYQSSKI